MSRIPFCLLGPRIINRDSDQKFMFLRWGLRSIGVRGMGFGVFLGGSNSRAF